MPTEELAALVETERQREAEQRRRLGEEKERARYFHHADAAADFTYWGKMAHWTIDEAIALSFGKSPSVVTLAAMKVHAGPDKDGLPPSPFALEYLKRTELARRSLAWKELYDPIIPTLFLRWAQRMDMKPPDELVAAVEARGLQVLDWKDVYEKEKERHDESKKRVVELEEYARVAKEGLEKLGAAGIGNAQALRDVSTARDALAAEVATLQARLEEASGKRPDELALSTVERNSLLRIIYGMATAVPYGFSPGAARSEAAATIASATAAAGCPVTDETIRKWLKVAAELCGKANSTNA